MNIKSFFILGMLPFFGLSFWESNYRQITDSAYYVKTGIEAEYKGFFAGGLYQSTFFKKEGFLFNPDHDIYEVNLGWRKDNFEIGYRHNCSHPVIPFYWIYPIPPNILREGAWDEIYIKLSLEGRIF